MDGDGADAGPAADRRRPRSSPPAAPRSPTRSDVATTAGAQALVDAAVERVRAHRHPGQQRRHHPLGRPPGGRRRQPRAAPRRARRRLVQHHPRRVAAHGRAGLRPHRDDDVGRACSACPTTSSYATAKGGVIGLTRSLATAGAAHGIKVNLIAPAAMTRMAGRRRRRATDGRRCRPSSSRRWSRSSPTRTARSAARSTPPAPAASRASSSRRRRATSTPTATPTIEDVAAHWADDQRRDRLLRARRPAWTGRPTFLSHLRSGQSGCVARA